MKKASSAHARIPGTAAEMPRLNLSGPPFGPGPIVFAYMLLVRGDCSHGAGVGTCAAADAHLGINGIDISLQDCSGRALALA